MKKDGELKIPCWLGFHKWWIFDDTLICGVCLKSKKINHRIARCLGLWELTEMSKEEKEAV